MNRVSALIKSRALFFKTMLAILIAGCIYLILFGEAASFISVHAYHSFWLNVFFVNYTFIGDGIFAAGLILICFFYLKKRKEGFALLYAFLVSGIFVQLIKNLLSNGELKLFFEPGQYLFLIDDATRADFQSFPSGHTVTAFAIATVFVLTTKRTKLQLIVLAAAILVGYSRMYLAQHFLQDVLLSSVLGTLSGIVAVHMAYNFKGISWNLNSLLKIQRKREIHEGAMQAFLID